MRAENETAVRNDRRGGEAVTAEVEQQLRVMRHFVLVCADDQRIRSVYPGLADRANYIAERLGLRSDMEISNAR